MATAVTGDPHKVLQDQFGLTEFRDGQRAVVERILAGKNVAAVFPTGGGKSLCYQLPSQMLPGTTLVVSPLIALMKDQCDALSRRGIAAARLDSSLTGREYRETMAGIRDGAIRLVYVSPERFFNERFLASTDSLNLSLFAIDEAHCISQWGHNFRPDYLKLAEVTRELGAERVLALTATATPEVLSDIRSAFDIAGDDAIRTRFHRANLKLRSTPIESGEHYSFLVDRLQSRASGPTLVYVTLQKTAEDIANQLCDDGFPAKAYHAGLDNEVRMNLQQEFIDSDKGIIVATIAFGMGIDKSNIRYVYHYNPPKSVESYAQEIGRAGRDGVDAICEMLVDPSDRVVLENFIYGDTPSHHAVRRLVELLCGQSDHFHISHYRIASETDIRVLVVKTLLTYLELDGRLKATSPRYDSYKVKPLVTSKVILDHFQGEPRKFAADVLGSLTKSRTLFTLNTIATAKHLNCDRMRIIKAVEYMSERGWLELRVSDLVHGYRWIDRPEHQSGGDAKVLADHLHERLLAREASEIGRMDEVFELAKASSCMSMRLAAHFGESLGESCGRCTACLGEGEHSWPSPAAGRLGQSVMTVVARLVQEFPDHFVTARDRARFLCGLHSPGFRRAKLTQHESYGVCAEIPFAQVLAQVGGESS
ncbi:MAG: RecQ family ATP-dependent DNA helicase [Planctomycetota bacterium]